MIRIKADRIQRQTREIQQLDANLITAATVDALNWTAYDLRDYLRGEMQRVFERPTRHTLNSIKVKPATPARQSALVWMDDEYSGQAAPATVWMAPQIFGRERRTKGFEKNLHARRVLPSGRYAIPGKGLRRNADGTVSRGHLNQLLSGLAASEHAAGWQSNATRSLRSAAKGHARAFFVMRRGNTPIAIAERRGKRLEIVLAFGRKPSYSKRFDFFGLADSFVEAELPARVERALQRRLGRSR